MNASRTDSNARSWFRSANCDARYGATLLISVALILALNATADWGREALCYQRQGLLHDQWWRLLSGHLVHLDWRHALLNCGGLVVLWALFARDYSVMRWLWILTLAALSIDAALWFRYPEVIWYLGASGVLHGAWAAGALATWRRGDRMGALLLLLLIIKLIYEQRSGMSVFEGELPLVPAAHLFGALGGGLASLVPPAAVKSL